MNFKRTSAAFVAVLLLSACGFQLRGQVDLPYSSLYIALPESNTLRAKLARSIGASSRTTIVEKATLGQAVLSITGDSLAKNVLSLNSAGRVREYQLVRTLGYRIHEPGGRDLIPAAQIVVQRDITFDDSQVLSKQSEEELLIKDMETDLVQQLLRRLAASQPDFTTATPEIKG